MIQVRCSLCLGAARADPSGIQPFRLVSSRSALRSLRHPSGTISPCIRCLRHRFCRSNRAQRFRTQSSRPLGFLALYLNIACLFQQQARSPRSWDLFYRFCRHPQRFCSRTGKVRVRVRVAKLPVFTCPCHTRTSERTRSLRKQCPLMVSRGILSPTMTCPHPHPLDDDDVPSAPCHQPRSHPHPHPQRRLVTLAITLTTTPTRKTTTTRD